MLKRVDSPCFDLLAYFEGETLAAGLFEDRRGRVKRRFTVDMTGVIEGDELVLREHFIFDDGERQQRTWRLRRGPGMDFSGISDDSVSTARGHSSTDTATLTSVLRLAVGGRAIAMRFEDVFHDAGGGVVLNRSRVSKWGIRLGQVLIAFRKPAQRSA